jgi:cytochrome d ubiquinol oxidase subunit I
MLSVLAYNSLTGKVDGIQELQKKYEAEYGPGDYVPPVAISYWTFRIMVGAGFAMLFIALYALYLIYKNRLDLSNIWQKILIVAITLPYLANSTGWIFTEIARQPWIVFGVLRTEDAVSPAVSTGELIISLVTFTLLYGALMVVDLYLLRKYAIAGAANASHNE